MHTAQHLSMQTDIKRSRMTEGKYIGDMCVKFVRPCLMLFCKAAINPKAPEKQKMDLSEGAKRRDNRIYNDISTVEHTEVFLCASQYHLLPSVHECTHIYTHFLIATLSELALGSFGDKKVWNSF